MYPYTHGACEIVDHGLDANPVKYISRPNQVLEKYGRRDDKHMKNLAIVQ